MSDVLFVDVSRCYVRSIQCNRKLLCLHVRLEETSERYLFVQLRSGLHVPKFMENICTPLIRAGEQLQVLLKLAETCELAQQMANNARTSEAFWPQNSADTDKEYSEDGPYFPALVFSKRKLEENAKQRERKSQQMSEKFDILFSELASRHTVEKSRASSHSDTVRYCCVFPVLQDFCKK